MASDAFAVPNQYPDVYIPELKRFPTDQGSENLVCMWLPAADHPGLVTLHHAEGDLRYGPGRYFGVELQVLYNVSEAGLRPALEAAGVRIRKHPPTDQNRFSTLELEYPPVDVFCARANEFLATHTPPGKQPFRFEVHGSETENPLFSAEKMTAAIANGSMLFAYDNEIRQNDTNYLYHDIQSHSVWLALPHEVLDGLRRYATDICAIADDRERLAKMEEFVLVLDLGITSYSLSEFVQTGRFSEGLKELFDPLGIDAESLIRNYLLALQIEDHPETGEPPRVSFKPQSASSGSIATVGAHILQEVAVLREIAEEAQTARLSLYQTLGDLAAVLAGSPHPVAEATRDHIREAITRVSNARTRCSMSIGQLTLYTQNTLLLATHPT